ncbi:MAG: nicotinate-nucleotide adenylyltransferase [Sphingopyxis sp.]
MIPTGLLGGSFNPAHGGHRAISLHAMAALGLDELWWLVSPGNVLKPKAGMAPLTARLASARIQSRRSRIRPTAAEAFLGTRYTVDTLRALVRRYPNRRFIWLMGADNMGQLHRWRDWRKIARLMPIAVVARPGYDGRARAAVVMGWFRRFVRSADQKLDWTKWSVPALVFLRFPPDQRSATALRAVHPDWPTTFRSPHERDIVMRRILPKDMI